MSHHRTMPSSSGPPADNDSTLAVQPAMFNNTTGNTSAAEPATGVQPQPAQRQQAGPVALKSLRAAKRVALSPAAPSGPPPHAAWGTPVAQAQHPFPLQPNNPAASSVPIGQVFSPASRVQTPSLAAPAALGQSSLPPTPVTQHPAAGMGFAQPTHAPVRGAGAGMGVGPFGTSSAPLQAESTRTWGAVGTGSNGLVLAPGGGGRSNKGKEREKEKEEEMEIDGSGELVAVGGQEGRGELVGLTAQFYPTQGSGNLSFTANMSTLSPVQARGSFRPLTNGGQGSPGFGGGRGAFSNTPFASPNLQQPHLASGSSRLPSSATSSPGKSSLAVLTTAQARGNAARQQPQGQQQQQPQSRAKSFRPLEPIEAGETDEERKCARFGCTRKWQGWVLEGLSVGEMGKYYHLICFVICRLSSPEVVAFFADRIDLGVHGFALVQLIKAALISIGDGGPLEQAVMESITVFTSTVTGCQEKLGVRFAFGHAKEEANKEELLKASGTAWGKLVNEASDLMLEGVFRPEAILYSLLRFAALPRPMNDLERAQHLRSLSFDEWSMADVAPFTLTTTARGLSFSHARATHQMDQVTEALGIPPSATMPVLDELLIKATPGARPLPDRGSSGATVKASDMKAEKPLDEEIVKAIKAKRDELLKTERATGAPASTPEDLAKTRFEGFKASALNQKNMARFAREEEGLELNTTAKWEVSIKAVMEKAHGDAEAEAEERGAKRSAEAAGLDGQAAAKQQELSCRIPDCRVTGEHDHEIKTILPNGQHMPVHTYHHHPLRTRTASDDMEGVQPVPPSPLHRPLSPARGPSVGSTSAGSPRRQLSSTRDGMHVDE